MKLTKIVCTIGPSCDKPHILRQMHRAGMNVLRVNLSHADTARTTQAVKLARQVSKDIAVLLDTRGPEIRTGKCKTPITLKKGSTVELILHDGNCSEGKLYLRGAPEGTRLSVGDEILVADGTIELRIISAKDPILARVINEGVVVSRKNVSIPKSAQSRGNFLSKKDRDDLKLARELDVEFVAASFIRSKDDVLQVRRKLAGSNIMLFSKIENASAIENLKPIIECSDGLMVARGDLGLSVPLEKVPMLQKNIIMHCNHTATPVITATQMLESMIYSPRPTRAEVGDVANAIFDGTDAVMLSAETAVGRFPVRSVEMLTRIATEAERGIGLNTKKLFDRAGMSVEEFISKSAYIASFDLKADAIVTHTSTGRAPRLISRYKPRIPIIAITFNRTVHRQLSVSFGVKPLLSPLKKRSIYELRSTARLLLSRKVLSRQAKVIVTSGSVTGLAGTTNMLRIYTVGQMRTQ
jgi:pyruvate kinase